VGAEGRVERSGRNRNQAARDKDAQTFGDMAVAGGRNPRGGNRGARDGRPTRDGEFTAPSPTTAPEGASVSPPPGLMGSASGNDLDLLPATSDFKDPAIVAIHKVPTVEASSLLLSDLSSGFEASPAPAADGKPSLPPSGFELPAGDGQIMPIGDAAVPLPLPESLKGAALSASATSGLPGFCAASNESGAAAAGGAGPEDGASSLTAEMTQMHVTPPSDLPAPVSRDGAAFTAAAISAPPFGAMGAAGMLPPGGIAPIATAPPKAPPPPPPR